MATPISEKNTKSEIIAAYNDALAKIKELKTPDRKIEKKKEDEAKIVETAAELSVDKIITGIGGIKLEVINALDDLGEKLIIEFKKLIDVQKGIEVENNNLREIYEIKAETDSLAALLASQKEKKENYDKDMSDKRDSFESEINSKRLLWKQEQEIHDLQKNERDTQLKKDRKREEEEYSYNLQLIRKKDADGYAGEKAKLDKELAEKKINFDKELAKREAEITSKEKEFNELKLKSENFPKELQKAIADTEKAVTEKFEFRYKHEMALIQKGTEGERNLNKQTIQSLEKKIGELEEQIKQLTTKSNEASQQVQTIAIKAIEGASAVRAFNSSHDKSQEAK